MQKFGDFNLPHFFNYPPYFTLQPVRDALDKQVQLWKELILEYCRTKKIFVIGLEEDFPLFSNPVVEKEIRYRENNSSCDSTLIVDYPTTLWTDVVKDNGLEDSVMTVEEIRSGTESRGTELHGIDHTILMRALRLLEQKGKLAIFKGTSADDEGVKFSL